MFHSASATTVITMIKALESTIVIPGEAVVKQGDMGNRMCVLLASCYVVNRLSVCAVRSSYHLIVAFAAGIFVRGDCWKCVFYPRSLVNSGSTS
jgi:hypothetical protein